MEQHSLATRTEKRKNSSDWQRQVMEPIPNGDKIETKLIILARFGRLECGKNFKDKGRYSEKCPTFDVVVDENYGVNYCR